jgi:hypothetical protein
MRENGDCTHLEASQARSEHFLERHCGVNMSRVRGRIWEMERLEMRGERMRKRRERLKER